MKPFSTTKTNVTVTNAERAAATIAQQGGMALQVWKEAKRTVGRIASGLVSADLFSRRQPSRGGGNSPRGDDVSVVCRQTESRRLGEFEAAMLDFVHLGDRPHGILGCLEDDDPR